MKIGFKLGYVLLNQAILNFSFRFISFKNHNYNNINELRTINIYIFHDVAGFLFLLRETSK